MNLRDFARKIRSKFREYKIRKSPNKVTKEDIKNTLKEIGIKEGDVLFVHSSLSKIGYVERGVDAVIDALIESVGKEGTIAMPTSQINGSSREFLKENPLFDPKESPSKMGKISETFRKRQGVLRSSHPTHSVAAYGKYAKEIVKEHYNAKTTFGVNTPYFRIMELNGKIVFIGVDRWCMTHAHVVEDIMPNFPVNVHAKEKVNASIIDDEGNKKQVAVRVHDTEVTKIRAVYNLNKYFEENNIFKAAKLGNGEVEVCNAKEIIKLMVNLAKQGITIYKEHSFQPFNNQKFPDKIRL